MMGQPSFITYHYSRQPDGREVRTGMSQRPMLTAEKRELAGLAEKFLREIDSHGIYNARRLDDLPVTLRDQVTTYTMGQTKALMDQRGLGGWLEGNPDDRLFYGWTVASELCRAILGTDPGAAYFGRGSSFRACTMALHKAATGAE